MNAVLQADEFQALLRLYADYASAIDAGHWELWPDFFTDDAVYRLQPRENHERGFPLATLFFESKAMLRDRVYAVRETLFHDPYYQRHVVGVPVVRQGHERGFDCEANYAVFRTKLSQPSTVFNVGRYLDTVVRTAQGLKFQRRLVVYDSELIPNSIIYPV
jgi:salicylate 5-hydroxylase small subunit